MDGEPALEAWAESNSQTRSRVAQHRANYRFFNELCGICQAAHGLVFRVPAAVAPQMSQRRIGLEKFVGDSSMKGIVESVANTDIRTVLR
jgi:hypothetical protein